MTSNRLHWIKESQIVSLKMYGYLARLQNSLGHYETVVVYNYNLKGTYHHLMKKAKQIKIP